MKRISLQGRIVLWLLGSIAIAIWLLLIVAPGQLGIGLELFLTAPVRERLQTVADSIAADVGPALGEQWKVELQRYDEQHGVRFSIYDSDGFELAGQQQTLPTEVTEEVRTSRALMQSEAPGDSVLRERQPGRPIELPAWPQPSRRLLVRSSFILAPEGAPGYWIGIRAPIMAADGGIIPATIVVHADGLWSALRFLSFTGWLAFIAVLVIVTLALWWPLLWAMSRALGDITYATQRLAEEEFDLKLKLRRKDELGDLADAVSLVAQRLRGFVLGQKQFLSDITHEVSSPIARLQLGLEVLAHSVAEDGRETFQDVREEVQLLTELAADLLAFSRTGLNGARSRVAQVSLPALVHSVLEKENARSGVVVAMPGDLKLNVNPSSLGRAIGNLVRNALRYAGTQNGPIEVVAAPEGKFVCIRVLDRGPGVPGLSLISLGNPFYRPEQGRKRSSGGLGLGLATVKNCVTSCGGSVTFRNREGGGFEAEILMPLSTPTD